MIIAQISDTHISLDSARNRETEAALQRAVRHLMNLPVLPDVVIVSGDCTDNGRVEEYERFKALLQPLTMPVYVIPGNHDDRVHLQNVFGTQGSSPLSDFVQYVIDDYPVRLIALDTNLPGKAEGILCHERLSWLEAQLADAPQKPTLLFMHHPPFTTGLNVVDNIGLKKRESFASIVARYSNVECIAAGHVHWVMQQRFHGTFAITCSATDNLLLPDFGRPAQLAVVKQAPVCLLHIWSSGIGVITYSSIIGDYESPQLLHDGNNWL
jgi:3',5'-cyclic-AMP phosphodiesterase